jgi:hypothetical protein
LLFELGVEEDDVADGAELARMLDDEDAAAAD